MNITPERLRELEMAERKLSALEQGGVYNWEWYGEVMASLSLEEDIEKIIDDAVEDMAVTITTECGIHEPSERGAGYALRDLEPIREQLVMFLENVRGREQEDTE